MTARLMQSAATVFISTPTVMNLDHILQQTIAITKQAGDFMQEEACKFQLSSIEYKGKNDLVSYVDKETEKILVSGLA